MTPYKKRVASNNMESYNEKKMESLKRRIHSFGMLENNAKADGDNKKIAEYKVLCKKITKRISYYANE